MGIHNMYPYISATVTYYVTQRSYGRKGNDIVAGTVKIREIYKRIYGVQC